MSKRTYTFQIEIQGRGETPEEAYNDAIEELYQDPGTVPDAKFIDEA